MDCTIGEERLHIDSLEQLNKPTALLLRRREVSILTDDDLDALVRKHGATSYRNRADTQNPAYGFTPAGLLNLLAEVTREIRKQDEALIRMMLEALECSGEPDDPGHRCSHCDDYVDRNSVLRNAARKRLESKP